MTLWRLEWLRLRRTWRGIALLATFLSFGLLGPLLARYLREILEWAGSTEGMFIAVPDPRPVDGLIQYFGNAQQMGVIVLFAAAAGALAIDASPELATFLRTRVASPAEVILRRYVVYAAAGGAAFALGAVAAWYQTTVLIGPLPTDAMLFGILYGMAYYAYLVAVVAVAAGITRGVVGAVVIAFASILVEPLVGLISPIADWLPGTMGAAMIGLVLEETTPLQLLRPLLVASLLAAAFLYAAVRLSARREI